MKIAVFHNLPSGGAKRSLYEWVKRLSLYNQIDLYGYSSDSENYLDIRGFCKEVNYFWESPIESTNYNIFSKIYLFLKLLMLSKTIAKTIDSHGYDVVFIHHDRYIQSPLLMVFLKCKSVYYCQEPFRRGYEKQKLTITTIRIFFGEILIKFTDQVLKLIDRWAINSADIILANSHYSASKIFEAYQISADVVYLGVNADQFFFMPEVKKKNMVLSVGRLHESKGHDFAILALSLISEEIRPSLRIMCDARSSEYKNYLLELAKDNKVSIVIETIPESEICKVYNQSLLLISAQRDEPLGLVALEAMSCGVPVVGVLEGGLKETIINNSTGFLVERDKELFSKKIEQLLLDSELRNFFGSSGLQNAKSKWSWNQSATQIYNKLNEK